MAILTDRQITHLTTLPMNLQKGIYYWRMGWVQNVKYNALIKTYKGDIIEDDIYESYARFNDDDELTSFTCSCKESKRFYGACRHVIALLKYIQEHEQKKEQQEELLTNVKQSILSFQPSITKISKKIPLSIEVFLESHNGYYDEVIQTNFLTFKIGLNKTYVLKDFSSFIEATENRTQLQYGKGFIYDPIAHELPSFFIPIYEILKEVHTISKTSYQMAEFFNQKRFCYPTLFERKIFESLINQEINVIINDQGYQKILVTDEQLPILVNVAMEENSLDIQFGELQNIISLSQDNSIILYQQRIYLLEQRYLDLLSPLLKASRTGLHKLSFNKEEESELITKFIPQNDTYLHVPTEIKEKYVKVPLRASLYLDKEGKKLIAKPLFNYDDVSFNPFSKDEIIFEDDKYIARDQEREGYIVSLIEDSDFIVQKNHLYIDNEDSVYHFVQNKLPILQEEVDVFYTDEFKNIMKTRSLSSSIRLNDTLNFLEINFSYDDIDPKELQDIFNSYKRKKKYHRLKDGSFLLLNDNNTKESLEVLDYLDISKKDMHQGNITLGLSYAPYLMKHFQGASTNQSFDDFITKIQNPTTQEFPLPDGFSNILRDYQVTGYQWLKTLAYYQLGGILADEMGLGKTLQTITFIASEKGNSSKSSLIVAPTSLVYNWEEELQKFAPNLKYLIISGTAKERQQKLENSDGYDIMITSYPLLKMDATYYQELHFKYMFIDEAQYIKNPSSLNAKVATSIQAECKFALTGTPIENSLTELWSIFNFILPGFLSNHHHFRKHFESPIIKDQDEKILEELRWMIQPFILRRLKKDVLTELSDKIERKISIDLNEEQQKVYVSYLAQTKSKLAQDFDDKGFQKSKLEVLTALMRLRQICCHPGMFLDNYSGRSSKLDMLVDIINESIEVGNKMLIFSQFTSMLQFLIPELEKNKVKYLYLDGSIPMDERSKLVKAFNEGDYDCFLISLKAGGTGLNLTTADVVIHIDPWWNPAVEDQATDRAHRIGQTKTVQVLKLITKGTIEDKIYELQKSKKELIENVIKPGENFLHALSKEELYKLFDSEEFY